MIVPFLKMALRDSDETIIQSFTKEGGIDMKKIKKDDMEKCFKYLKCFRDTIAKVEV
jgi:hypothetical protein